MFTLSACPKLLAIGCACGSAAFAVQTGLGLESGNNVLAFRCPVMTQRTGQCVLHGAAAPRLRSPNEGVTGT